MVFTLLIMQDRTTLENSPEAIAFQMKHGNTSSNLPFPSQLFKLPFPLSTTHGVLNFSKERNGSLVNTRKTSVLLASVLRQLLQTYIKQGQKFQRLILRSGGATQVVQLLEICLQIFVCVDFCRSHQTRGRGTESGLQQDNLQ